MNTAIFSEILSIDAEYYKRLERLDHFVENTVAKEK